MKRIDNETTVLLESPFKRHTYYAPKRVFNIRNLALASIALAVFCGIGAGAITVNVGGISKVWAQAADTSGPVPQGNTTITAAPLGSVSTSQGLDGSQQKNLDEVRAKEADELNKAKARSAVPQPAKVNVAQAGSPPATVQGTPCAYGANLTPEQCKLIDEVTKSIQSDDVKVNDAKAKALTDYAQADRDFNAARDKADKAKAAIATATAEGRNAAIATYQVLGAAAKAAGDKAKAARATATAAGATPQELQAAITGVPSAAPAQPGQQVVSLQPAPPAPQPQVVYAPRPTPSATTVIRAPRPTTNHVRCDRILDTATNRHTFVEIPPTATDTPTTGWCSAQMIGASVPVQ